jgi:small subunit ribosomal protein S20
MPNHKSAEKRVRQSRKRKVHNKYYAKTMRNAVKRLRNTTDKQEAENKLPEVTAMIDKMAKKNIIHKNKAANLKSSLAQQINRMGQE